MKAIILSHERGGAIALDRRGDFRFIKGYTSQPIGTEIEIKTRSMIQYLKMAAIAACLIIALATGGTGLAWNTESCFIYVDINPSVELVFNSLNRLKNINPINEDGAALLEGLTLRGQPGDVIAGLIQEAERKGYIDPRDDSLAVFITISARGGKAPDKYLQEIGDALDTLGIRDIVGFSICDKDLCDKAAALGISPGKLILAEHLYAAGIQTTVDELNQRPVRDLIEKIRAAEGENLFSFASAIADSEMVPSGWYSLANENIPEPDEGGESRLSGSEPDLDSVDTEDEDKQGESGDGQAGKDRSDGIPDPDKPNHLDEDKSPDDGEKPNDPDDPEEDPEDVGEPDNTDDPEDPEDPGEPDDPDEADEPDEPEEQNPKDPDPEDPGKPLDPVKPDKPSGPKVATEDKTSAFGNYAVWSPVIDLTGSEDADFIYWRFLDSGVNGQMLPSASVCDFVFTDSAGVKHHYQWVLADGFSTNNGGNNPSWVVKTPGDWTLDYAEIDEVLDQFSLDGKAQERGPRITIETAWLDADGGEVSDTSGLEALFYFTGITQGQTQGRYAVQQGYYTIEGVGAVDDFTLSGVSINGANQGGAVATLNARADNSYIITFIYQRAAEEGGETGEETPPGEEDPPENPEDTSPEQQEP